MERRRPQDLDGGGFPDERAAAKIPERLLQLLARVHDDGSVPGDRFLDRRAGDQQEAHALVTRLPDAVLLIRTADCVPLFVHDPIRRAIGLAHVGWRGLAANLPFRLLATLRHVDGNRTAAAGLLGVTDRTIRNKLRAWREQGLTEEQLLAPAGAGGRI